MFLEKNIEALKAPSTVNHETLRHGLITVLRKTPLPTEADVIQLCATDHGDYTLLYKNQFLHSPELGAVSEAKQVFDTCCTPGVKNVHLQIGLGLGYLLEHTFTHSDGKIIVYEPHLPVLRYVFENVDLAEMIKTERVVVTWSEVTLNAALKKVYYVHPDRFDMAMLPSYNALLASEMETLMESIYKSICTTMYDVGTYHHFHYQWIQQFFDNLPYYPDASFLDKAKLKCQGKPALIISRGPSLQDAIEDIKSLKDSMVLIAVGGALELLHANNIVPDFAVFADANGMKEQFENLPTSYTKQINFVNTPFTQQACFSHPTRERYVCLMDNMPDYTELIASIEGHSVASIGGGTSVSILALQIGLFLGCSDLILIGQDLAFRNHRQVYAGNIELQEDGCLTGSTEFYTDERFLGTIKGQNGEDLTTLKNYRTILINLEDLAEKVEKSQFPIRLLNASIGGAHIKGYPVMSLSEYRKTVNPTPWKQGNAMGEHNFQTETEYLARKERYLAFFSKMAEDVDRLLNLAIETGKTLSHKTRYIERADDKKLRKLEHHVLEKTSGFMEELLQYPFISYFLILKSFQYERALNIQTNTNEGLMKNILINLDYLRASAEILSAAKPLVAQALDGLKVAMAQSHDEALSSSIKISPPALAPSAIDREKEPSGVH